MVFTGFLSRKWVEWIGEFWGKALRTWKWGTDYS